MIRGYKLITDKYRYKVFVECDNCGHIIEYEYSYELAHPKEEIDPVTKTKLIRTGPVFNNLPQVCKKCEDREIKERANTFKEFVRKIEQGEWLNGAQSGNK